jgi:hypothetical protein
MEAKITTVIHTVPLIFLSSVEYKEFLKNNFEENCLHIFTNEHFCEDENSF